MKVVPFPRTEPDGRAAGEQIDAALNGDLAGPDAQGLRELRDDIRALAAPLDPEFERELQARVAQWSRDRDAPRPSLNERVARLRRWIVASPVRSLALGGAGTALAVFVLVFVLAGSGGTNTASQSIAPMSGTSGQRADRHSNSPLVKGAAERASSAPGAEFSTGAASGATASPGRLQQLGASVTLATSPDGVQEAADSVARVATGDGGYVESSHVLVRQSGPSEAQLRLSVPSAKLGQAIAALGRIAPVRAVSQESQDITSSYDAARRQLRDDEAVRRALLRALAAATTQGQIESLRERLASNRGALARDRAQVQTVSRRAASSQLEVTISGGGSVHEGLTLNRGLHDAGDVLAGAGAVLLIALAVLAPLGVVALLATAARRSWLRHRREAALGP